MLTVICVCKSSTGGNRNYTPIWVGRLHKAVEKYLFIPHRFVCLTDLDINIEGVETIPLIHNWEGYWSKIELFRPDIPGDRFLYIDLDTLVTGVLNDLVDLKGSFIAIHPKIANAKQKHVKGRYMYLASGAMVWDKSHSSLIYDSFNPEWINTKYKGDQDYIGDILFRKEVKFTYFPTKWIRLLRTFGSLQELGDSECKLVCCSPNGWRMDIVTEWKGKKYNWVKKLWKGK